MGAVWWVIMFLSSWGVLLLATDTKRFKAFWTGGFTYSLHGIALALGAHGLRFLSLLGLHHALGFDHRRESIVSNRKRRQRLSAILKATRLLWPVSWPVFSVGTMLIVKGLGALTKRPPSD